MLYGIYASAIAGAFLAPPGEGEIITTASFSGSNKFFDSHGKLIPVPAYEKFELSTYIEYGVTDWLTLVATPSVDHIRTGNGQTANGIGDTALGARMGLFQKDGFVVSVQGLVRPPLTLRTDPSLQVFDHSHSWSGEARGLLGYGTQIFGRDAFVDFEAGYRWNDQVIPGEWRTDLTLGLHATRDLLLLLQDFTTISDGRTASSPSYFWTKGQISAVYRFSPSWSIQAGGFLTLAGRNAGREIGPLMALWYRF